jgi:amino acid adenylation domain-containing protein
MKGQECGSVGTAQFLSHLRSLDVQLAVVDGRLACNAPKGVLTLELQRELKARKSEILDLLLGMELQTGPAQVSRIPRKEVLSFGQQRLWYLDQLAPLSAAYNISFGLRLEGLVDREALDRALREIVLRHEILRTAILTIDGSPETRLMPGQDWKLSYLDLRCPAEGMASGSSDPKLELTRFHDSELRRPFDLASGNLLRATLVQTGDLESTLLLAVHHIAADGWSLGILIRELTTLYLAFHSGLPSSLPRLRTQYSDYSSWQREWLESGVLEAELPYWKQKLLGVTPVELPSDRTRPGVPTSRGRRIKHEMSREVAVAVRELSRREGVTLHMALLSGFYLLLHRYTGQTDLTVGGAVAGRDKPEFENLIGLFINNLAFRTSLASDPTIKELLRRVMETSLDGYAHQHVPFDRLVAALLPLRDLNRAPFFELMFNLQNIPLPSFELADLMVHPFAPEQGTARFDLTVDAVEAEGSIHLYLEYSTDLYDEATIRRFAHHFERLLAEMAADSGRRISELRMLSDSEISELLANGQGRILAYQQDKCVSEWIETQSAATPDAVAVLCEGREVSYGELSRRSNQLAHRLRELGAGRGSLVGVCLERSEEMIIAVLAVLKAGAAYVPLDPQFPADRLGFMAEDSAIPVLVTQRKLREVVPICTGVRVLEIDTDRDSIRSQDPGALPTHFTGGDLAYVIYTSGSTGKPKGVEITHRALANFLSSMLREPGMTASDCLLSVTTLSFDIAGLEIYLPLIAGARIVVATRETASDGRRLAEAIAESGATVLQATPATWRLLLEAGWKGNADLKMICGGEALPQDLAKKLLATGGELWNAYGPTETTIWSTLQKVTDVDHASSIGRPIANTQVLLLDEGRQLAPFGAIGELYIGGDGLARGYLNRAELTRERFVDHPFSPGEKLYRTGDQARWLPDGTLEFLGRMDQQVKIRGFRVELGEIEAVLESIPEIRQAVVALREFGPGDQRLAAYVSLAEGAEIDPQSIRKRLAAELPDYMVPAHVTTLASIPLTPNGKVDKRALPAPQVAVTERSLPRSELERRVAEVWQEVLSTTEVGIHDNFFDVGGHSLLLVQMQSRLRRNLGGELSIQDLFRSPTVAAIAERLSAQAEGARQ